VYHNCSFLSAASVSKSRRDSDIISMLVNIYGSKELFVNEYRTLLADRILTNFNYEIEKEIRYLELLKVSVFMCTSIAHFKYFFFHELLRFVFKNYKN